MKMVENVLNIDELCVEFELTLRKKITNVRTYEVNRQQGPNQTQRMEESKLVSLCGWKEPSFCFLYNTVGLCDCARVVPLRTSKMSQ